jgi:hypothetical protein
MYQVERAIDGWMEANGSSDDGKLPDSEAEEIWTWMQNRPPVPLTLKEARRLKANGAGTGQASQAAGR